MADAEPPDADTEASDQARAKSPDQQAEDDAKFLEDERRRELPKDDWPGKGQH